MTLSRRNFLRLGAAGIAVAAAPAMLPERRFWQVGRNAPVCRQWEWAVHKPLPVPPGCVRINGELYIGSDGPITYPVAHNRCRSIVRPLDRELDGLIASGSFEVG